MGTGESQVHRIAKQVGVDIRTVWPSEPKDFTPWLAENLDYLEDLQLGTLTLVRTEAPVGSLSLDILAEMTNGDRVAIENQFKAADHDHLTRGLAYAIGSSPQSKFLVVIAEHHKLEFKKVAEYMNSVGRDTTNGIGVYLVEVSVLQGGDSYFPQFNVVVSPTWASEKASLIQNGVTGRVDDFIEKANKASRPVFSEIIASFKDKPGRSITYNSKAVLSLYVLNPGTAKSLNIAQLSIDGTLTICRGNVLDSKPFEDEDMSEIFDSAINELFVDYKRTPKNYYPSTSIFSAIQVEDYVLRVENLFQSWIPNNRSFNMEASLTHISRVIRRINTKSSTWAHHGSIVDGLLKDPEANLFVKTANELQQSDWTSQQTASNMVAWWSQKYTVDRNPYKDEFLRMKVDQKYSYWAKELGEPKSTN